MKAVLELIRDGKRSQHGGILSGVLIMTAFVAIIAGALMTELSGNFLLASSLMSRTAAQATINSSVELSLSQLQSAELDAPCPSLSSATVNNLTASANYLGCWPTVRETPQFASSAAAPQPFSVDGTHSQVNGFNDYVVAAGGTVYDFTFGSINPRWTLPGNGQVTATPLIAPMPFNNSEVLVVIPLSGSACSPAPNCVNVRLDSNGSTVPQQCSVATSSGPVITQPAASPSKQGIVFYAEAQRLEATDLSVAPNCDPEGTTSITGSQPIAAGPIAFQCQNGCGPANDWVYVVVSDGSSSQLQRYRYCGDDCLSFVDGVGLTWPNATGLAVSAATLPAKVAITFAGGQVSIVQINSDGTMSPPSSAFIGAGISDAPYWCHCPSGDLIGVAGQDGSLHLYYNSLQPYASLAGGGAAVVTTPGADLAGNWYFGANDHYVHEVQLQPGQSSLTEVQTYGPMDRPTSAVQVGRCASRVCVYVAGANNHAYLVPLDARRAIISACLTTSPPNCTSARPRLWASVEVGAAGNPQAVHVQGWSYYSG